MRTTGQDSPGGSERSPASSGNSRVRDLLKPSHELRLAGVVHDLTDSRLRLSADSLGEPPAALSGGEYLEALRLTWDEFADHLRRGRYLALKALEGALRERLDALNEPLHREHLGRVIEWRLLVLDAVLWEYELYGATGSFDGLDLRDVERLVGDGEDVKLALTLSRPDTFHDYVADTLYPESQSWDDAYDRLEKLSARLRIEPRYTSGESLKSAHNKWRRDRNGR